MRSKHQIFITVPIPSRVPPEIVLAHIQTYTPMLANNKVIMSFKETTPNMELVSKDPFFGTPNSSVRTFSSSERLILAPGLTRDRSWPVTCLSIPNGIRCRADAKAGVTVRTEWIVRPRQDFGSSPSTTSSPGTLVEEWELYEEVIIEANSLIMPFVARTADEVHRGICQKVVDEVVNKYLANGTH
ncbi:hypothetical protein FMUND_7301 [Fusarium mundagurra]|uniref:DUF7053 domain-containing protein n=1 Tax=Fusarium mundagurra TaxID=1567541 RepID=A0A8H6DF52_9HYPO|nr:hypothetical protein FMUND_7301 [Fusarium mundagurra]